jgi:predicted TIM-barrel fold metal-dependent hydrolase
MSDFDFPIFDADNHYYEALDAFTRHVHPNMVDRCVQWAEINGRKYHIVGGRVSRAVSNATFDPISKPGALYEYFRGNPEGKDTTDFLKDHEPIPDYYRGPEARVAIMDDQGLDKIWIYPTLGVLYEELLKEDIPAVCHTFTALNRWVADDWGLAYKDRIFAAPYIALADVDHACQELEWALGQGATTICMRPAAPTTMLGHISPFHSYFDPFWARVNEAGLAVIVHCGDSGFQSSGYATDTFDAFEDRKPSIRILRIERPAHDFFVTTIFDKIFVRFPNLRFASVENGAAFLPGLFRTIESAAHKQPIYFKDHDPIETFKQHVWINPFWEDRAEDIVEMMGADRVIFGSDWPHVEGMKDPLDYTAELKGMSDKVRRMIMHDNAEFLNTPRPV